MFALLHGCIPCSMEAQLLTMLSFLLPIIIGMTKKLWSKVKKFLSML